MSAVHQARNPLVQPPGALHVQEEENNLDERIYLYVIVGQILQGIAIVGAITLAVCAVTVSPAYLVAELLPMFLWALGKDLVEDELDEIELPPEQNPLPLAPRHVARNLLAPAPRIPSQPIGFLNPHNGHRCCTNSIVQVALVSRQINVILDEHPSSRLAVIRQQYRETDRARRSIAETVNTRRVVKREESLDAGSTLASLLASLKAEIPAPILNPSHYSGKVRKDPIDLNNAQAKGRAFCELLMRPNFQDKLNPKFAASPEEFFIQIERRAPGGSRHPPLPIPLRFDLSQELVDSPIPEGKAHFEVDAFVVHSNFRGQGHYVSYKRTANQELGGYRWWRINDHVVTHLTENEADQALKEACIVHCTRADLAS